MTHALLVRVVVTDVEHIDAFKAAFAELHHHSRVHEPGTLTYELRVAEQSAEDAADRNALSKRTLLIIERYQRKSDLTDAHSRSEPFKRFMAWIGDHKGTIIESVSAEHWADAGMATNDSLPSANGILVFCGARPGTVPAYVEAATELGKLIGRSGRNMVYGAGTVGVMGAVAQAARDAGGRVISVIPHALAPKEIAGSVSEDAIVVETMAERKAAMFSRADTAIILPGGIGTLDELFEVLTLTQLNAYRVKIGVLNTEGFYVPLLAMLDHLVAQKFLEEDTVKQLVVRSTPADLWEALEAAPAPVAAAPLTWARAF